MEGFPVKVTFELLSNRRVHLIYGELAEGNLKW